MTSAADFHILSARNVFGLVAVVVAVLIPVGLKRVFKKDLGELGEAEAVLNAQDVEDEEVIVPVVHTYTDAQEGGPGRSYIALDSGMILAGPSCGDEGLDTGRKGKGKAVEIFANIKEEEEEEERQESTVPTEKTERAYMGRSRGYGSTDVYSPAVRAGL